MIRKINKELLVIKFLYFFELGAVSCLYMYLTSFMYEYGVTTSELAIINFIGHISSLFARPITGFIADRYQKYKEIIIVGTSLCIFINTVQLAVPKFYPSAKVIFHNHLKDTSTNSIQFPTCDANSSTVSCWSILNNCLENPKFLTRNKLILTHRNVSCSSFDFSRQTNPQKSNSTYLCTNIFENCTESLKFRESGLTGSSTFWLFLMVEIFSHGLNSALHNLTDALTFVNLGKDKSHNFGFTRVFGTFGLLTFSITTGLFLYGFDWLNKNRELQWIKTLMSLTQFFPCFVLFFIVFVLVIIIAIFLRSDTPIHSEPFWKYLVALRNLEIAVFLICSVCGGITLGVLLDYYFLIMNQMFHDLPKYFPGVVHAVMTLSELVFIGISPILLKYMNDEFWISFAFCVWSIKWLSYLFVSNYFFLLFIEVIHGAGFGLMLPCMMSYVSKFANKATQARIQSIFSSLFFNIGGALGALYGGTMLDKVGYRGIFLSMFIFTLSCAILYFTIQKILIQKYFCRQNEYFTHEREIFLLDLDKREVYV